jgi:hypothetical protein
MSGISVYEMTTNLNMHSLFTAPLLLLLLLLPLLLLVLFLGRCLVSLNDDDSTTHTSSAGYGNSDLRLDKDQSRRKAVIKQEER